VAWAVPHSFWKDFRRTIKELKPECLLINEVLPRQQVYHDDEFDMSYDTDFYGNILDVLNGRKPLSALDYGLKKTLFNYPQAAKDLRYLENHDLPRFLSIFGEKKTRVMAALLFTVPGTPLVYYGQETGMLQMRPNYRGFANSKWFDFFRELIKLRKNNPALTGGIMSTVSSDNDQEIWHYRRILDKKIIDVFINLSSNEQNINLPENISKIYFAEENLKDEHGVYYLDAESFIICELGN
jgi:glycosidase